jgi:trans-2,3-dihydro-3-hydroxyanthranilate isomerase
MVPARNLDALNRAKVNRDKYFKLIEGIEAKCLFLFCRETRHPENHLSARMFADYLGVPEDPATGSANGCLAGYLLEHDYLDSPPMPLRVEQGHAIARPSLLWLNASKPQREISVSVGGQVILVAKGELL